MGFTRVELLVAIGIIALLFSIVLALWVRAHESHDRVVCQQNLRQIGQAILIYSNDENGR
jgi:type II secretory pathway pseudopilin PulG